MKFIFNHVFYYIWAVSGDYLENPLFVLHFRVTAQAFRIKETSLFNSYKSLFVGKHGQP